MHRIALITLLCTISIGAQALSLTWTLPAQRENGAALPASEIKQVNIYRNGQPFATVTGAATSYKIPPCLTPATYAVSVTDTGSPALESALSNSVSVPSTVTAAECAPKPPTNLRVQ